MPKIKFLFLFILCLAGSFRLTAQEQLPTQVDLQQISKYKMLIIFLMNKLKPIGIKPSSKDIH
ncbi:exported hypothetical protein [Capnocytophaga canimorsus]|nr:hypothetical protein [Capnocytophaga canimorsus]CEN47850.1 exported hypothetical protein [Capnocytophaga canimorsus]